MQGAHSAPYAGLWSGKASCWASLNLAPVQPALQPVDPCGVLWHGSLCLVQHGQCLLPVTGAAGCSGILPGTRPFFRRSALFRGEHDPVAPGLLGHIEGLIGPA